MNKLDKIINYVAPKTYYRRAEMRSKANLLETTATAADNLMLPERLNSGYSNGGASKKKSWAKRYNARSKSAKSDIEKNRKTLRERSRDLSMNNPIGCAALTTNRTNCIGSGLIPKPKIDYEFLGITKEEAKDLEKKIRKEFAIWAESTLCDNNDQNNFYELQQIVFMDWLRNGEEFILLKYSEELDYMPYQLRLKLIEADRVCTPGSLNAEYYGYDEKQKNGNTIMNGIEISKEGKVEAYYVSSTFPGEYSPEKKEWVRIAKRGKRTGNPNILHIFNADRAEQYRGVPFLAPVIEVIKQMDRYTEAEIMAAVVNAYFAVFVTTEDGETPEEFKGEEYEEEDEIESSQEQEIEIGSGTVHYLKTGEGVETVTANHPASGFDVFINSLLKQVGAALDCAPEVLLKSFNKSFSASKGAMNESWKAFRMRRTWFINDFCQEVYNMWFAEAVSKGRINAPGFFNNILIRKAYTNCTWNGPTQGQLEPGKEVAAAAQRVKEGFSTREDECAALNGSDYEDNIRTLENENKLLKQAQSVLESED